MKPRSNRLRSLLFLLFFVSLFFVPFEASRAQTGQFCMSDSELFAFMRLGFAFQTGRAVGICCKQDASPVDACRKSMTEMTKFEGVADPFLRRDQQTATVPYVRAFGTSEGPAKFRSALEAYQDLLLRNMPTPTSAQCRSMLGFSEMASLLDETRVAVLFRNMVQPHEFAPMRQAMPTCP